MIEAVRAPTVILVTDPRWPLDRIEWVIEQAGAALPGGSLLVQLRDKAADLDALAKTAGALRAVTTRVGARLVVNASTSAGLRVAIDAGADGAHVPCNMETLAGARDLLGAGAWISTPAHSDDDVVTATRGEATAVLVSPIFDSPGKGTARGVAALVAARALAQGVLLYALGGIDASRAAECAEANADGVAVIRALLDAPDPSVIARLLDAPFERD